MSNQQSLFPASPLVHKVAFMPAQEQASLKKNASEQEKRIMEYFRLVGRATPCQTWQAIGKEGEPVTSYRRAITNLTEQGKLEKLDVRVMGYFGKSVHVWRVVE